MSSLSERMTKARQFKFEVENGPKLILQRPTMYEWIVINNDGFSHNDLAKQFVVGWEGVKECDIIKGGSTDILDFDSDAWHAWLDENGEWWSQIGKKIIDAFSEHIERKEAAVKN